MCARRLSYLITLNTLRKQGVFLLTPNGRRACAAALESSKKFFYFFLNNARYFKYVCYNDFCYEGNRKEKRAKKGMGKCASS